MQFPEPAQQVVHHYAILLAALLCIAFGLSFLARHNWIFDLFSHFMIQYAIAAFVLGCILLFFRDWLTAAVCAAVFFTALSQLNPHFKNKADPAAAEITVVQYNKFNPMKISQPLLAWIRSNSEKFDVITIQEISSEDIEALQALKDIYPYRFPEKRMSGADAYIMSRHPFEGTVTVETGDERFKTLGLAAKIKIASQPEPVTIYTIHAKTPMSSRLQQKRNRQLLDIAKYIHHNKSKNIILMGDWNITPYSPYFHDLLKTSGLKHDYFGFWPVTTWPAPFLLPFLKIPIDHVLSSPNMRLVQQKTGPFFWSDHNAHIASFAFNRND